MMGDPMRRALVQIQGILAELDKNMIVAKLRKARERQRTKSGRCEGRKPYGANPEEVLVLEKIVALGRYSNSVSVADALNEQGYRTRYGKRWNSGTISKILARQSKVS
jgi:site-specific DNA recombinase